MANITSFREPEDEHLRRCWRQQFCPVCLDQPLCSWCPFTQSCVPNTHNSLPFLAPAYDKHICPHWSERWELRTKPLGCSVSTITSLSVVGAITAMWSLLAVMWAVWAAVTFWRGWRVRWRMAGGDGGVGNGGT